jgi:hypothetical protein
VSGTLGLTGILPGNKGIEPDVGVDKTVFVGASVVIVCSSRGRETVLMFDRDKFPRAEAG